MRHRTSAALRATVAAAMLLAAITAHARNDHVRIRYAEPIQSQLAGARTAAESTSIDSFEPWSFAAFGRQFDLELEPNARLLNALSAEQRRGLATYAVYRGRVRGMPGSWVRLTQVGNSVTGAIWDGVELYSIAPAASLRPFVDQSLEASATANVIYRLSDTHGAPLGATCLVQRPEGETAQARGSAEYTRLVEELQSGAAQLATRQLEVAVVGDTEFVNWHGDARAAALARLNIVDGIFAEQVGVLISAALVDLPTPGQPDSFTTNSAPDLLRELRQYRTADPRIRAPGLAHLFTGRDLNDNVAGIAFLETLCSDSGVGVTEGWHPELISALIAAHEIGHNFGAPHDGEAGSLCINESQNGLMSPVLNTSDRFSRCALNQMYVEMEGAACLTPANASDAMLRADGLVGGAVSEPIDVAFEVASVGTADLAGATVTIALPGDLTAASASIANGSCTVGGTTITCDVSAIPAGTARAGALRFTAPTAGSREVRLRVSAPRDHRPSNDQQAVRVEVGSGADVAVGISPDEIRSTTGEPFSLTMTVGSVGTTAASDVRLQFTLGNVTVHQLEGGGGSCAGTSPHVCLFGTLAAGETRRVRVIASSAIPRSDLVNVGVQAANETSTAANNNFRGVPIRIAAARDVMIEANMAPGPRAIGETFDVPFTVASIGREMVNGVVARLTLPTGFVVDSAVFGARSCTVNGLEVQCAIGDLAASTSRRIVVRGRGTTVASGISGQVTASNDGDGMNNSDFVSIQILPNTDLALGSIAVPLLFEGRPATFQVPFSNAGVATIQGATLTATLPASFTIVSATSPSASCQVSGGTASCSLNSLPRGTGSHVRFEIRTNQLGTHTATFAVSASGDSVPANDSSTLSVTVAADVDVAVTTAEPVLNTLVDRPVDVALTVRTGVRAIDNVSLNLSFAAAAIVESLTPQLSCTSTPTTLNCPLGTLAGGTTRNFTLRLRFSTPGQWNSSAHMGGAGDTQPSNNFAAFTIEVEQPADLALSIPQPTISAIAGQPFFAEASLASVGGHEGRNVRVRLTLPAGISLSSPRQGGCSQTGDIVECLLGTVSGGTSRTLGYDLQAASAGGYTIQVQSLASNDVSSGNDSGQIVVQASAAAPVQPPTPPPSASGGGGGGGGGAVTWWLLLALLGALPLVLSGRRCACRSAPAACACVPSRA